MTTPLVSVSPDGNRVKVPFAVPLHAVEDLEVDLMDDGLRIRATKGINRTDPYLPGHFPQFTIFPGVFMLESVTQAVCLALADLSEGRPFLESVVSARFLAPLLPGDIMTVNATIGPIVVDTVTVSASCERRGGTIAAKFKMRFRIARGRR